MATKVMWLNSDIFLGVLLNRWYTSVNPERSATSRRKFDELSGSHSQFLGQSSFIPALRRWSYARYHFAYLKWVGELNMFMSFFNVFWKNKVHNLTIKIGALFEELLYERNTFLCTWKLMKRRDDLQLRFRTSGREHIIFFKYNNVYNNKSYINYSCKL